ncbi:MAG: aminodeoxychorismate/anthranilate synthase component II [Bacteroidetes bacterium]|nr:aminodeoxychorismate/anthranilate synthase component II [Bacteroidota bacterium]
MLLLIDNYDSFTYNLSDYFYQLEQEQLIIRNDEKDAEELSAFNFSGIVLSPGPGTPQNSGNLMKIIEYWHEKVPILGICLGHQALGCYFGAKLIKTHFPMHGKISETELKKHPMWNDIPNKINVCRYHSLAIDISKCNNITQTAVCSNDNINMAFAHKYLPIWGIQFHPEAILTEYGLQILKNWLNAFILHKK